jgi:hypothetical protein
LSSHLVFGCQGKWRPDYILLKAELEERADLGIIQHPTSNTDDNYRNADSKVLL